MSTTIVTTTSGPVRGRRSAGGSVFLGVPYAAAPTGRHRFTAPRPHPPWTDVRDCTTAGPTAPQPARDLFGTLDMAPFFGPGWRRGEDYLTVDIRTPHAAGRTERPAPVLVFVHGGGFVAGSTGAPLHDGSAFARDGVVLVTVNYRLGIPGFLHLPDAPDNRGLLDVVAALRWVHDNAARFGGDPGRVTLAGQSAGAIIVGAILAGRRADGLVHRAVMQSGSGTAAFTPEQARIVATAAGRALDLTPTARALAAVPDEHLVAALPALAGLDLRTATDRDPLGGITPLGPVLTAQPATTVAGGTAHDIDLLIGTNRDEGSLYLAPLGLLADTTPADVLATAARFHDRPHDLVDAYRRARPTATDADLRVAILGTGLFRTGTDRMATAHAAAATTAATYRYEFTWRSDAVHGLLGASHVMELPFVFDVPDLPALHGPDALLGTAAPPPDLAPRMHAAWVRFTATGNPGWPPSHPNHPTVQHIGATWELLDHPAAWS